LERLGWGVKVKRWRAGLRAGGYRAGAPRYARRDPSASLRAGQLRRLSPHAYRPTRAAKDFYFSRVW
jgi:hypothetical protein